jgi:CheY-like chemotaxis protein
VDGMNEIVSGAMTEIQSAVENVDEINSLNNSNFTDLKQETEKFKVDAESVRYKVLVVDDDETHLIATKAMLDKDYEVITAKSGREAISLFYRGLVPCIILLDLMMPGIDGWDTYDRIRAIGNLHNVPTAFFTASDDPRDRERALKMGAADFISKPVKKSELVERIRKAIKK